MAKFGDLPSMISEFIAMARAYLLQETLEPAKKLATFGGFSFGAAAAWAAGIIFLGVAGLRAFVDLFPASPYWEALGYVLFALILGLITYAIARAVPVYDLHTDAPPALDIDGAPEGADT